MSRRPSDHDIFRILTLLLTFSPGHDAIKRLLWCTIRYGDKMRAWVDVGYSTAEDN